MGEGTGENGKGASDLVLAYALYSILETQEYGSGYDLFSALNDLRGRMTSAQIAKAQDMATELWEKYVVPFKED
tara:strand:- start:12 stop:233 length:222 start_codon:yes stop_codon:yes gene_type:complete